MTPAPSQAEYYLRSLIIEGVVASKENHRQLANERQHHEEQQAAKEDELAELLAKLPAHVLAKANAKSTAMVATTDA